MPVYLLVLLSTVPSLILVFLEFWSISFKNIIHGNSHFCVLFLGREFFKQIETKSTYTFRCLSDNQVYQVCGYMGVCMRAVKCSEKRNSNLNFECRTKE